MVSIVIIIHCYTVPINTICVAISIPFVLQFQFHLCCNFNSICVAISIPYFLYYYLLFNSTIIFTTTTISISSSISININVVSAFALVFVLLLFVVIDPFHILQLSQTNIPKQSIQQLQDKTKKQNTLRRRRKKEKKENKNRNRMRFCVFLLFY